MNGTPGTLEIGTVRRLRDSKNLVVLTGAGVSAESGIPTFRGEDGLWKEHKPETLATPEAFARDPDLVWSWYHWRRKVVLEASPNPAHNAIAAMERHIGGFTLITQNVDRLHVRAGSKKILELHGDLHHARCSQCAEVVPLSDQEGIVTCGICGGSMRPNVVWFGESLDAGTLEEASIASATADFMIVAGTSNVVQPAATLAYAALERGGYVLEVNMDPTPLTGSASATVLGKAGEVLPELVRLVFGE